MALSQAQLLKHKEKKNKSRKEKAKTATQALKLQNISQWPIVASYAPFHSRDDYTMQYALIVRKRPNGEFAMGLFLIDTLCLGVKDCFMKIMPSYQFSDVLERLEMILPMDEVSPSYVATFVRQAVEYSKNLGLDPQGDYQIVKKFLEGIPLDLSLTFTFGENGEPVYVLGPNDSKEFSNNVLATLNDTVGDNYKFVIPLESLNDREN